MANATGYQVLASQRAYNIDTDMQLLPFFTLMYYYSLQIEIINPHSKLDFIIAYGGPWLAIFMIVVLLLIKIRQTKVKELDSTIAKTYPKY